MQIYNEGPHDDSAYAQYLLELEEQQIFEDINSELRILSNLNLTWTEFNGLAS